MEHGKMTVQRLEKFHNGTNFKAYEFFGCHKYGKGVYVFRVWTPHAKTVKLVLNGNKTEMRPLCDGESFEVEAICAEGDVYFYEIETYDGRILQKADPYAFKSNFPNSFYSEVCSLPQPTEYAALFETHNSCTPINIYEVNLLSWNKHADGSYYTYRE